MSPAMTAHREAVLGVRVAEPLDVVEDEPGEGDDHEDDEGDRDEEDGRLVDGRVGRGVRVADGDAHQDARPVVREPCDAHAVSPTDEHRHDVLH